MSYNLFRSMPGKFRGESFIKKEVEVAPNTYYPVKPSRHLPNIDFKLKKELEEFSKNLGYKVPNILKEKQEAKRALGPSWHDVVDLDNLDASFIHKFLERKDRGFSLADRFPDEKSKSPGPGTYIKKHKDLFLHQFSPICSFEWNVSKRGFKDPPSWSLAPNRYYYERDQYSLFENLQRRKVSRRGPYDLFTGPRDETTIKNHFGPPLPREAKNWPYALLSSIDALVKDQYKGVWSDCPRQILLPTKDTHNVSPCQYDPILTSSYKPQTKIECGFNSGKDPARPEITFKVHPGPGRYRMKYHKNNNGCTSAFVSKGDRFAYWVRKDDRLY